MGTLYVAQGTLLSADTVNDLIPRIPQTPDGAFPLCSLNGGEHGPGHSDGLLGPTCTTLL